MSTLERIKYRLRAILLCDDRSSAPSALSVRSDPALPKFAPKRSQRLLQYFPTEDEFAVWVRRSIADLNMHPANFLLDDGVPGSKNRVALILKNPHTLRFGMARRLHREIVEQAKARDVELLPLHLDALHQEQDQ